MYCIGLLELQINTVDFKTQFKNHTSHLLLFQFTPKAANILSPLCIWTQSFHGCTSPPSAALTLC